MKITIATLLAMVAGCGLAVAAGIYPPITTMDGKTYDHITAQRTDPDGLYIEYTLPGNGMGVAKVKFSRLSARLRKLCGYNAEAGREYEDDAYAGVLAYQNWVDERQAARKQAQAEAYAYQVQQAAMIAQLALAPAPAAPAPRAMESQFYSLGSLTGRGDASSAQTVTAYQDFDPQARLIGPSSFSRSFSAAPSRSR
jgi:hypothetical protein